MTGRWVQERVERRYRRDAAKDAADPQGARADGHETLSRLLVRALGGLPLADALAVDVGTGRGRLAFLLAGRAGRVVGFDLDAAALAEARREAERRGAANVRFVEADAEAPSADYAALAGGRPDLVAAHLCLSDAILGHSARALARGGHVAVAGLHRDQWGETGVPSRFAYDEAGLERSLAAAGLRPLFLGVERTVLEFEGPEDALSGYLLSSGLRARFEATNRLAGLTAYLARGGRTLTTLARVVAVAAGPA